MTAFYNEIDPFAAQWLRNLIAAGHIAPGVVDERSIADIEPYELANFTQCHFFAGIGVWSYALRQAGWTDDRPIWTGSCPCQPFSNAGKQEGFNDARHVWPEFDRLIEFCKPPVIVGEQVENAGDWIDLVSADLEAQGYAFGAAFLPAAGFDGAHIRSRNYWLAHLHSDGRDQARAGVSSSRRDGPFGNGAFGWLGNNNNTGLERRTGMPERADQRTVGPASVVSGLADAKHDDGRTNQPGWGAQERIADGWDCQGIGRNRPTHAPMLGRHAADWLFCRDGKWRPVEPGTFPLVDAAPARVGRLRAYGNALDAETATNFCAVVKEICD